MSTLFSDVLTQYAMQFIDDVRWQEQLALNPAQFFRAKSQTLISAIPRFNRPPNMQEYLKYVAPSYADAVHTVTDQDTFPLTITTTATEFDLCNVGYVTTDAVGGVTYSQNVETQDKTINKEQTESSIEQLEKLIQDCDTALANLQKTINSGKTNPEEIFYARTAFIKITEQRKDLIKRLEEAKKTQKSTINFFDASNER